MADTESTSPCESLIETRANGILRITLNRPDKANAITAEQRDRIIKLMADADRDPEVRAIIIDAKGKYFCSGADVGLLAGEPRIGEGMKRIRDGAQRLVTSILDCTKPVIASVQGTAAGLGAHIAYACDLIVASEAAKFIEVFVLRGLTVDAAGAYLLARRIGLQKAKEMVFLGDPLAAADAATLGLINRLVAPEALAKETDGLATRLAAGATTAIGFAKMQLNRSLDGDRTDLLMAEAMAQELTSKTHDADEGIRAFVERRTPNFVGY